jgi:hypothetical protein
VVGVAFVVVIVTLVVGRPTRPAVALALERTDTDVTFGFRHRDGEPVDGNRTSLAGVGDGDALAGTRFQAGDTVRVVPVDDGVTRGEHRPPDPDRRRGYGRQPTRQPGQRGGVWLAAARVTATLRAGRRDGDGRAPRPR